MNPCELCKGACCERFGIDFKGHSEDVFNWISYHGEVDGTVVFFNCKCHFLRDGKCSIYDDRPKLCKDYPVGSKMCLEAVYRKHRDNKRNKIIEAINEWKLSQG